MRRYSVGMRFVETPNGLHLLPVLIVTVIATGISISSAHVAVGFHESDQHNVSPNIRDDYYIDIGAQ